MAEPPEFWVFIAANLLVLGVGAGMASLSVRAYRRTGKPSLRYASVGFALITVGAVSDAVYDLGIRATRFTRLYDISGRELLLLYAAQAVLLGLGLAALFYSLRR